jgi:hypothetical protein
MVSFGALAITDSTIANNSAGQGGGILASNSATVTDTDCTPGWAAADGYYQVDIKLPSGQTSMHHFDRLLGDVTGDGIVDQTDLNEIAADVGAASQLGWAPLSADATGSGTVTTLELTIATRSKGHKLGSGLSLG